MTKKSFFLCFLLVAFGLFLLAGMGVLGVGLHFYWDSGPQKELAAILEQRQAEGVPTRWQQIVPPLIPDEENFCSIPLLESAMVHQDSDKEDARLNPLRFMGTEVGELRKDDRPPYPSYHLAQKTDLAAWQKALAGNKKFPAASGQAGPAQSVLSGLSLYQNNFNQLRSALARPDARFPINYDLPNKYAIEIPHVGTCISTSQILALRASAFLRNGQPAEAWSDLQIIFKFRQGLEKEPMLISNLVDITIVGMALTVIWEGLAERSWSPSELRHISETLASIDYLQQYRKTMTGEWIFLMSLLDEVEKHPKELETMTGSEIKSIYGQLYFKVWPRNTFIQARITAWNFLHEDALPACPTSARIMDPAKAGAMDAKIMSLFPYSPGNIILKLALPAVSSAAKKFGEAQADVDMARIACALELNQLKTKTYPEGLAALDSKLPRDIVNGEPYRYRKTDNGRYEIWSVGWNKTDDDALVVWKPDQRRLERGQGDWVWRYPN